MEAARAARVTFVLGTRLEFTLALTLTLTLTLT